MKTLFPNSARLFEYSLAFSFDRDASEGEPVAKGERKEEGGKKKGRKGQGQGTYKGTSISSYRKLLFDKLRELVKKEVAPKKVEQFLGVPKHLIGLQIHLCNILSQKHTLSSACHCLSFIMDGFLEVFQHFYAAQQIKRRRLATGIVFPTSPLSLHMKISPFSQLRKRRKKRTLSTKNKPIDIWNSISSWSCKTS